MPSVGSRTPRQRKHETRSTHTTQINGKEQSTFGCPGQGDKQNTGDNIRNRVGCADVSSGIGEFFDDKNGGPDGKDLDGTGDSAQKSSLPDGESKGIYMVSY